MLLFGAGLKTVVKSFKVFGIWDSQSLQSKYVLDYISSHSMLVGSQDVSPHLLGVDPGSTKDVLL